MTISNGMILRNEFREFTDGYGVWDRSPADGSVVRMNAHFKVLKAARHDPVTIHVDLSDTTFSPAKKQIVPIGGDGKHLRGWYQDKIVIRMYLNTYADHFNMISDGPSTSTETGSTTNTVSVSSGVSASAGFFGDVGTGNVGASASKGTSNSHTQALKDFTVYNKSDNSAVQHEYVMSMIKEGVKYNHRSDLVADFKNGTLYEPPALATSNFPITSQAIWQAKRGPDGQYLQVEDTVELKIEFHQFLSFVISTNHVDHTVGGVIEGAGEGVKNLWDNLMKDGSIKVDPGAAHVSAWDLGYDHKHIRHTWLQWLHLEKLDATILTPVKTEIW